jgi:hypothetical protein
MINFYDGRFTKGGAAMHLKPPHVLVAKGGIQELTHLCSMDVVYSFDKVNGSDTHKAVGKILDHRLSKNVKNFVSNLNQDEMKKDGFRNEMKKNVKKNGFPKWTLVRQYTANFAGSTNSREFYFYVRSKWVTPKKKTIRTEKFEFECEISRELGEIDPLLREMYGVYMSGRGEKMNCNINLAIAYHNLNPGDHAEARDRSQRRRYRGLKKIYIIILKKREREPKDC